MKRKKYHNHTPKVSFCGCSFDSLFCLCESSWSPDPSPEVLGPSRYWNGSTKLKQRARNKNLATSHIRIVLKLVKANTYCGHQYVQHDPSLDNEESEA